MVLARGCAFARSFRHMQADLDGPHDQGEPPPRIRSAASSEVDLPRAHAIFLEAFEGEWGTA
jgi:hypothetical protein